MGQVMMILSNYWNDELKVTIERDKKVSEGIMTQKEADQENQEWGEVGGFVLTCEGAVMTVFTVAEILKLRGGALCPLSL